MDPLGNGKHTVDGSEIRLTIWYGEYPILHRVLYIPGGAGYFSINSRIFRQNWRVNSTRHKAIPLPGPGSINKAWLKGAWWLILPEWGLVSWGCGIWGGGGTLQCLWDLCCKQERISLFLASYGWDILYPRGGGETQARRSILHIFW